MLFQLFLKLKYISEVCPSSAIKLKPPELLD